MKINILALFLVITFLGCSSDDDSSNNMDPDQNTELMGDFVSVAHPTSGTAIVSADMSTLQLNDFKSDDGPLLELYLTTDLEVTDYVSLGILKGLDGNYTYDLPDDIDLTTYNHLVVWCVDFSVNFGYAILK
ncbi:DM13 domain-containing protein [Formosa sp. A9]|uniref:DM13 domain-containing protein n=1 Tax=Formosa sp. A9 TaxID=3442641 RepID=UPI003EBD6E0D